MAMWIGPVFDRTQADVEFAKRTIAEWIAATITGHSIVAYDLKGCLNVSDINRIESNVAYLSEKLATYCYTPDTSTKSWTRVGMPNEKDVQRITRNVKALIDAFYIMRDAPAVPKTLLSYEDVNAVEKNISLIKDLLDSMVNSFKKSGSFRAGSTMVLPTRR